MTPVHLDGCDKSSKLLGFKGSKGQKGIKRPGRRDEESSKSKVHMLGTPLFICRVLELNWT